jgi:16S rRNA G966 N2-methylase RsmD
MYDNEAKIHIAKQIKNISFDVVEKEMNRLIEIGCNAFSQSSRCRTGNNIVDYYTFQQRLETKGKYNVNFYEFVENFDEFREKKFIKTMLAYYTNVKNKNKKKNNYVVLKEVYNICISAINIIRPLVYMEIYIKYKPQCVLDFCAGWGGAAVACAALNIPKYIGIEINTNLQEPYNKLLSYLKTKSSSDIQMIFEDALKIDYSTMYYDFVFTSPPYYFIQQYENNVEYDSKQHMNEEFYKPIFTKVYNGLQPGGYFAINVCKEVYDNVLCVLFGKSHEFYPYKKSHRQNRYNEMVYVWKKPNTTICTIAY